MLSMEHNDILTRVGPGTPLGELMREYWVPACLPSELKPDATPTRLKLLGEKLIAFRDTQGRIGILDHRCPHRCASMFFGRNEEGGIRCAYHGWKFDVEGNCLDQPNLPEDLRFTDRVKAKAYKVAEKGGIVWVYMGKRKVPPPLPALEVLSIPDDERMVMCHMRDCNWLQSLEGDIDTSHFGFLHAGARAARRCRSQHHASLRPARTARRATTSRRPTGARCTTPTARPTPATTSTASPTSCSRSSRWCRTAPSAT